MVSGFAALRRQQQERANSSAAASSNPCASCLERMLKCLDDEKFDDVPCCYFWNDEYRDLQSREAYIKNGVLSAGEAPKVLRCMICYQGGRDCYQVPKEVVDLVQNQLKSILSLAAPSMGSMDISGLPASARASLTAAVRRGSVKLMSMTQNKFAKNPDTPFHSGRDHFVDTGILGLRVRDKSSRKAADAELDSTQSAPKRARSGSGAGQGVVPREEFDALSAQVRFIATEFHRMMRGKAAQEAFARSFNELNSANRI